MGGKKRYSVDYGLWMTHLPWGGDDNKALEKIAEQIASVLQKEFPDMDVMEMMKDETWLNASEMLNAGLIDGIIETDFELTIPQDEKIDFNNNIYNEVKETVKNKYDMMFRTKIKNEAVETPATPEVKETTNSELETLKQELEELKNQLAEKANKESELEKNFNALKEEKEKLETEKANMEKEDILNSVGVKKENFNDWLKLDLETVKNLSKTFKVNETAPDILNIVKEVKLEDIDLKNMSHEAVLAFAKSHPKEYAKAFLNMGKKY